MIFDFEYLSELGFIVENILDYETGSQMGLIDKKKAEEKKSRSSVPLRISGEMIFIIAIA
jgi:hypothetical protein